MEITLLYFDDCPNWKVADQRLAELAAKNPDLVPVDDRQHPHHWVMLNKAGFTDE